MPPSEGGCLWTFRKQDNCPTTPRVSGAERDSRTRRNRGLSRNPFGHTSGSGLCAALLPKEDPEDSQAGYRTGCRPLRSDRRLATCANAIFTANRSVFYDLGFDEAQARVLAMRADLMAALRQHIKGRGWTQSKAAKELGITQPGVSALMKGAWRDFSADMLLVLASRVGLKPTLKLAA
jgi:predicted XRE-type DNA-binding protein